MAGFKVQELQLCVAVVDGGICIEQRSHCCSSLSFRLEYPGVSPELSYLKEIGRAEFHSITDQEALHAYGRLCRLEGICPSLEASHALAFLDRLCPDLPHGAKIVVNCSGRGDKDADFVFQLNQTSTQKLKALLH
ncbi:hypothetical protein Nepgr_007173 [Nepenthes gracilis]|uniref:Uncharacterized protein n=1 Tax=Nepenthes gracilis TaxID=150966 RepID=A0AAD3S6J8_NEPGR|nr:hypothetical protein Nepgr_007173 [Nepenthes gracilis]